MNKSDYNFDSIRQGIDSPSLQAFIRNPQLTHQGCGIAKRLTDDNREYFAVSCIVGTMADPRDGKELRNAVFEYLNSMREKRGKAPFAKQPRLQHIADEAIAKLTSDPESSSEVQEKVSTGIEATELVRDRSLFGVFTIYDLEQLETNSTALQLADSKLKHIVLGIRKITDPNNPVRGIFIYYIAYR